MGRGISSRLESADRGVKHQEIAKKLNEIKMVPADFSCGW
jgi:hypothetical protein